MGVYQRDKRLLPQIQENGCLFLCFCYIAGIDDPIYINKLYNRAVSARILNSDCYVNSLVLLADMLRVDFAFITHMPVSYKPKDTDIVIARFFNNKTNLSHFAVVDKFNRIVYDPLQGESNTIKNGYIADYRIISRRTI